MKNAIITAKRKKTELKILLICFILSNIANLYSIIAYRTSFIELFTSLGYVVVMTIALYIFWCIVRLIIYGIRNLRERNKQE